jgi:RNA recognition motif-containing protein
MDLNSGRTKGYGFVTFNESEKAAAALIKNGEILKGRRMRVNWAVTTKDQQLQNQGTSYIPTQEGYISPPIRTEVTDRLFHLAQLEGLDVMWYVRLPLDTQALILRTSGEAPGARVVWVGNLDKTVTRTRLANKAYVELDLMPHFAAYGLVAEVTMVAPTGYAFITMASHLVASTLIVIFKDLTIKGRKIKTGWSHHSQRQVQQFSQPPVFPPMGPPPQQHPQNLQMQAPMPPLPIPQQQYPYQQPLQPIMYNPQNPYMQPVFPVVHSAGTSTPQSATSGNGTLGTYETNSGDTPSPESPR